MYGTISDFLRSWVVPNNALDLALVRGPVFLEEIVSISLGWGVGVGVVKEVLNTEEDLLDGDSWLPTLFFVQN